MVLYDEGNNMAGYKPLVNKKGKLFSNNKFTPYEFPNDSWNKSGLGSIPLAVQPGDSLETVQNIAPSNSIVSSTMQYANPLSAKDMSGSMVGAFNDAGVDVSAKQYGVDMPTGDSYNKYSTPAMSDGSTDTAPKLYSYMDNTDRSKVGYTGNDMYKNSETGQMMNKEFWGPDTAVSPTGYATLAESKAAGNTFGADYTDAQYNTAKFDQGRLDSQNFSNYAGAGMGAIQTGLGVLSYFDNKAMNKKNMQLIDQQIANNQDVMKTRTERAGDIKKYFG
jgi:hypothetical protein